MKKNIITRVAAIGMATFMAFAPISASAASLLKRGSGGSEVKMVQTTLKDLGYFTYPKVTGYYGLATATAVKRFQKDNGLYADGIVGTKTRNALLRSNTTTLKATTNNKSTSLKAATLTAKTLSVVDSDKSKSGALDWFSEVKYIWERNMNATVTDVNTGKSFEVKRTFGTNHADVEPLTKEDTNIIKSIWGGFGWERRAVVVKVGDYILAASMTSVPHAGVESAPAGGIVNNRSYGYGRGENLDAVKNNGVSGVMDIHFKNSRTHSTNVLQKSQQDMVKKAADYITKIWS